MNVLYEDDHLLAVDKPAGMVVHPTYKNKTGTLLDAVTSPGLPRPSIAGRLDKWTSGIVLVAKSAAAHAALQRTMGSPESEKIYLAIVSGRVEEASGEIDFRLKVDEQDRRRVIVASDGAPSLTRFERLGTIDVGSRCLSILRCRPMTGRRHQIRVHLSARGWPLVGDPVYGDGCRIDAADPKVRTALAAFPGQALHSWRVTFAHPAEGRTIRVEAPIPDPMAVLVFKSQVLILKS